MPAKPGTIATWTIALVETDTFTPISGARVALEAYSNAIGDFRPIRDAETGLDGTVTFQLALPTAPGRYRFRCRWDGDPTTRGDRSPEVRIDVQ